MRERKKIRVYIADDHQLLTDGLTELIDSAGFSLAGTARDGKSAVGNILLSRPEVILMDLDLPCLNGLEATRQILHEWPEASIIIISMHLENVLIKKAIKLGAKGYLPKSISREEFVRAIEEVANAKCYFSVEATRSLAMDMPSTISSETGIITLAASLTQREEEVLKAIAEGYSNRAIANQLHLSAHTVDSHRKSIMRKLDVNNTAGLVRLALKAGLVN